MPYTTVPTLSDGAVLAASHLNLLSANQSYLFGVANNANTPFNSYRSNTFLLNQGNIVWWIRHRCSFLHWKYSADANWNYARIYYNGVKVGMLGSGLTWTGVFDLRSFAGAPNMLGAWVTGFAYSQDVDSNNDDGHLVTQSGATYRCKLSHTSSATNQPGIGASWATYWDLLTLPGIGTFCQIWPYIAFTGTHQVTVEWIFETDSVSL